MFSILQIWKKKARRINEGKDICKQTKDIKRKKRKNGSDAHSEQRLNCGHLKPRKSCYICLRFLASQESTAARGFADQQTSASKLAEQQNKKRKLNTQFLDTVVKSKHVQENPLIAAQLSSSSHIDIEHSAVGIPILKPAIENEALEMLANEDETLEMSGDQVDVKAIITTAAEPSSSEAMTNAKKQVCHRN